MAPRFGHLNFRSLELLSRKKMVKGIPSIQCPDQLSKGCLLGKQFRQSFYKETDSRPKKQLELIHKDVCAPVKPSSFENLGVFPKAEVESVRGFKEIQSKVEKERGCQIKAIRSAKGEESLLRVFKWNSSTPDSSQITSTKQGREKEELNYPRQNSKYDKGEETT
ncbi:hypothetical protein V2J09_016315 [Rumex salicifolius]